MQYRTRLRSFASLSGFLALCSLWLISCDDPATPEGLALISSIVTTTEEGLILRDDGHDWLPRYGRGETFSFISAFPNPTTSILWYGFDLGEKAEVKVWVDSASNPAIRVPISSLTREAVTVRTLINNDSLAAGNHLFEWDLKDDSGNDLPAGMYRMSFRVTYGKPPILVESYGDVAVIRK